MFGIELSLILSVWAAVLSTVLAAIKIWESWNSRFQIEVSSILRSCVDMGNDVSITNLSSTPVLLEYMEVYSEKNKKKQYIYSPEDSWLNVRIEPQNTKVYNFSEGEYFSSGRSPVYIRLRFAGKKPLTKRIT
jgi:hypothetical protein